LNCCPGIEPLFGMPRNLEHRYLLLASKNRFKGIVRIDQRFFDRKRLTDGLSACSGGPFPNGQHRRPQPGTGHRARPCHQIRRIWDWGRSSDQRSIPSPLRGRPIIRQHVNGGPPKVHSGLISQARAVKDDPGLRKIHTKEAVDHWNPGPDLRRATPGGRMTPI
jgi:hypothetical protein